MRPSDVFLAVVGLVALGGELCLLDAWSRQTAAADRRAAGAALVRRLGLTDLALFGEARYTRHPSQADRFAPFQDHPSAREHFPSGALVPPPP
jgi:hypothetical protein